jgi:hypothetical protein
MAHINTAGVHIPLWMTAPMTPIGWGQSPWYPNREGTFFGQIMLTNDKNNIDGYYCNGPGFDSNTVPGRLGSDQGNVPYANAYPTSGGDCNSHCVMQANGDGAISCPGNGVTWTHPITVWRGQTFQAEDATLVAPVGSQSCTPTKNCGNGKRVSWIRPGTGLTLKNVNAAQAGTANIVVYYTNGDPVGSPTRTLVVKVNGGADQVRNFNATGADWNTVVNTTITVSGFNAGSNNTVYFGGTSTAQAPDIDFFEVINSTSTTAGTTAATAGTFSTTQAYRIKPVNGSPGLSLDISGNNMSNGTAVNQSSNNTTTAQKFFLADAGGGYYYIKSGNNSAKCIDDPSASTANGAQMQLWDCNNSNAQKWDIDAVPGATGQYTLRNVAADNCLDTSGPTSSGTRMTLWDCQSGNANQKFTISNF